MGTLIGIFFIWCLFAVPLGWVLATIESKLLNEPKRLMRSILFTVFLGVIGILIVGVPMILKYAGGMRADARVQAEAARLVINDHQNRGFTEAGPSTSGSDTTSS